MPDMRPKIERRFPATLPPVGVEPGVAEVAEAVEERR